MIAAGIPSFISWLLVALNPNSFYFLLGSRLLAGLSNGLLTGNVYMADVAPSQFIRSFKSIEVIKANIFSEIIQQFIQAASKSMGAILIFAITMIFHQYGFRYVAIAASIFPFLGLIGIVIVFSSESPIFKERYNQAIAFFIYNTFLDLGSTKSNYL